MHVVSKISENFQFEASIWSYFMHESQYTCKSLPWFSLWGDWKTVISSTALV